MIGRRHGAGIAKPVHDDRRRSARKHTRARIARMPIHVHEDINAVVGNLLGRFIVRHLANVGPVLHRGLDASRQRAVGFRSTIIGKHLDVLLAMQLEELSHQVANRVIPQVRGNIANAHPARLDVNRRTATVNGTIEHTFRRQLPHVTIRRRQVKHRIIGVDRRRQRMNAAHERLLLDPLGAHGHGPFALRKPQRDKLLDEVALVGRDLEALLNGGLRAFDLLAVGHDARDLLERRRDIGDSHAGKGL